MNNSFSLQNRVLHFFRLRRKKLSFLVNYHFCKGFKKAKIHFFLMFFFALFAISPEIDRHTFCKITFFCVFLQIFFSKKNRKKSRFFPKKIVSFSWKSWNGLKTLFLPKMTNLAFQKNSEKNVYTKKFRKKLCRKKLDILSKFTIFFCRTRRLTLFYLPWVLMKTGKNRRCGPPTVECAIFEILCKFFVSSTCRPENKIRVFLVYP